LNRAFYERLLNGIIAIKVEIVVVSRLGWVIKDFN